LGLGDEIMCTAWARRAALKNPDGQIFVGLNKRPEWSVVWENNPYIHRPEEFNDCKNRIMVPHCTGNRPYIKGVTATHLIYNEDHRPEPGDIFLTDKEKSMFAEYKDCVLIEPHVKGSFSGMKAWSWDRWQQVSNAIPCVQINERTKRGLQNVKRVHTGNFRQALAMIYQSKLVITTDGALHHAAAALGKPAVVLWGARTHPKVLGYESHVNLYTGDGESCGAMTECRHCIDAMKRITPEMVITAVRSILEKS
jgi:ADP-heptose:LPS heptosyltransferase